MFYVFPMPAIVDTNQVSICPDQQLVTEEEKQFLLQVEQYRYYNFRLRQQFQSLLEVSKIDFLVQQGIPLLKDKALLDQYLATNVRMMTILLLKKKYHPKFEYKRIMKAGVIYKCYESSSSIEEACACEIVMARYMYSMAMHRNAMIYVNRISQAQLTSQEHINMQDIQLGLELAVIGVTPIQKMCNVMDDLLKSLVTDQQKLIAELRASTIYAIKLILEANVNFIYLEQLRSTKTYELMMAVAKTNHVKLTEAHNRLTQQQDPCVQELIDHCYLGIQFYKIYTFWCLLMVNEQNIRLDRFKEKTYQQCTTEVYYIGQYLVKQQSSPYIQNFINAIIMQHLQKALYVYKGQLSFSLDNLFDSIRANHDYFQKDKK